jgi:exopolysaccharide biosynthesis protein
MDLVTGRNPRTCLCETKESLVFITIDGRSNDAAGMSLSETQQFWKNIGCIDAINLDGGGSTTMWIKGKGIVNFPSDSSGERPVSNALLLIKK